MRAGPLKHTVRIEERVETTDSWGDPTVVWSEHVTTRAAIRPTSGREFFEALAVQTEVTLSAIIRWYPGITTKMRLVHENVPYNIVFVQNLNFEERWIRLLLSEGLTDG